MNPLVVDADSHVLEPPELWETYLEPRFRERGLDSLIERAHRLTPRA